MKRKDKEKNDEGSKGLGRIVRKLKNGYARPLLYIGKKVQKQDGTSEMRYYTNPREVDAQVRKEWKVIYDGNAKRDYEEHAQRFREKYN